MGNEDPFFKLLTAPFRFVAETLQMFVFFVLVAGASIIYPFYLVLTHQPTAPGNWIASGLVFMLVVSLVRAPIYTVFGGIAAAVTLALCSANIPGFQEQMMVIYHPYRIYWLIFWFLFIGIMQSSLRRRADRLAKEVKAKKAEAEEAESRRVQEAKKQKLQRAENKERAKFRNENREIITGISALLSSCGAQTTEMLRAVKAIDGGDTVEDPKRLVITDIARILAAFRDTGSSENSYLEMLWREIVVLISQPTGDEILRPLLLIENEGVKRLGMVSLLANYDKQKGTNLASQSASAYLSFVSSVSNHCGGSLPAKIVTDAYIELLRPYIHESDRDRQAGNSNPSRSKSTRKSACEKCIKDYELLGLPVGASKDEVEQKRCACAEVLHPDQLGSKSKRARDAAEQQLKNINAACDRVLHCRCAFSAN